MPTTQPLVAEASPFSRAALVAYLFLIMYASWYPFSGWQTDNLVAILDVARQWPRYWTAFDASINVVGYLPLGVLLVFALYPLCSRPVSVLLATIAGTLLSVTMEGVQYFLPSRVTSILDVITNSSGTLLGALLGALLIPSVLEKGRLRLLRRQWLHHEASREMLILGLWPLAQIYPQAYLFGLGQILPLISFWLDEYFAIDIDLSAVLLQGLELDAAEYLLSETIITACGATGAVLICLFILNRHAPKFWLSSLLLVAAVCTKALASALLFKPEYAFGWLTPGARGGLLISAIMLYGFSFAPSRAQRRLAILMLLISLILINLVPSNPYFLLSMQNLTHGKFLNFYGAAQFLSICWPLLALWYLFDRPIPASPLGEPQAGDLYNDTVTAPHQTKQE
ncbi:VanZ family protein [Undibacterium sp.]|uniref:VanZ family protein n=1 Tax=Undibacterium sp. TaxID=1914977 RepID=UPI0025D84007|nr:VanZ family protein [Undibacterium sp.]